MPKKRTYLTAKEAGTRSPPVCPECLVDGVLGGNRDSEENEFEDKEKSGHVVIEGFFSSS